MRGLLLFFGTAGLFLGWNAPNHYPPWTAFHLEYLAALGACLIAWAALALSTVGRSLPTAPEKFRLRLPPASWPWMLAGLIPLVQYFTGALIFHGDAVIGLLYGVGVGLCVYTGCLWSAQEGSGRVLRVICLTAVVAGIAANGLAIVQWLRLDPPGWWAMELIDDRPYANLAQPNHFGLLMVMALVAVTALFESAAITSRSVYALAVAYFGWGVLISQSRASALALLAIAGLWLLTRKRAPTRLHPGFVVPAVAVWVLLASGLPLLQETLSLESTALRTPAELGARHWIWLHFWEAIWQRPWFGYGFNQGVLALSEVADRVHPSRNVVFAHNFVLDLMTWFGIPLALAFTAALAVWMAGWLRRHREPDFMAQRHLVFALWLALVIQSSLEFPFAHTYFLLPLALMAGAVTKAQAPQVQGPAPVRVVPGRSVLAIAMVTTSALVWLGWEYLQVETDFRARRFERANVGIRVEQAALQRPLILDQLAALNTSAGFVLDAGMPASQLTAMRDLARRFHILSTRMEYAKALALNGRLAEAEHELRIIRSSYEGERGARIEREWRAWLSSQAGATGQVTPQSLNALDRKPSSAARAVSAKDAVD